MSKQDARVIQQYKRMGYTADEAIQAARWAALLKSMTDEQIRAAMG